MSKIEHLIKNSFKIKSLTEYKVCCYSMSYLLKHIAWEEDIWCYNKKTKTYYHRKEFYPSSSERDQFETLFRSGVFLFEWTNRMVHQCTRSTVQANIYHSGTNGLIWDHFWSMWLGCWTDWICWNSNHLFGSPNLQLRLLCRRKRWKCVWKALYSLHMSSILWTYSIINSKLSINFWLCSTFIFMVQIHIYDLSMTN